MRVIVAEKPSVARAIAAALGVRGGVGDGHVTGAGLVLTWCLGHLVALADPEEYDAELAKWRLETLPIVPSRFRLKVIAGTRRQFNVVAGLLRRRDLVDVVNACDSGREGELIFDLVRHAAGCEKPVLRLWTPSLTEAAIREAYRTMKPASAYRGLLDAARCRQEADWLVGMNATRAQTLVARTRGADGVFSVGRVQTPTLALLVERDAAIRRFVPEQFFTVQARFLAELGRYEGTWFRATATREVDRFPSREEARALVNRLSGRPGRVASVVRKDERIAPQLLHDLTTLQREANRRFGWSAAKTLEVAQALYEAGAISYPRTSARHLTDDVAATVLELLRRLGKHPAYGAHVREIERRGLVVLGRRFVDGGRVEDHHAIIPTPNIPGTLGVDRDRLYDLVVRRLLGAHFGDRVESRVTVATDVAGETFRTRAAIVKDPGWSVVDPLARKEIVAPSPDLPPLAQGQRVVVGKLAVKPGKTTAPKPFTEGDLLAAMQAAGRDLADDELRLAMKESGLGTPATRAAIIETLLARRYIARRRRTLVPTEKGIALIRTLPVPALTSAALTGEWEAKLARISRGAYDRGSFMKEMGSFAREIVETLRSPMGSARRQVDAPPPVPRASGARSARPAASPCSRCGRPGRVVWSQRRARWFLRCDPCAVWIVATLPVAPP